MKKLSILIVAMLVVVSSFAQRGANAHVQAVNSVAQNKDTYPTGKTSAIGSTETLSNIPDTAKLVLYTVGANSDSGYVAGTDYWNDVAFAERYDFNGNDSSVQVIGVFAQFGGTVNPASTQAVAFNLWDLGVPTVVFDSLSLSPFPNNILDSFSVPFTQLGIGLTADTMKLHLFTYPQIVNGAFFVGYSINYNFPSLAGDNIGLASSATGHRISAATTVSVNYDIYGDTLYDSIINVQNATMESDYNWYDNYTQNDSLFNDLAIYPVVVISGPTSVKGITKNDLTFFGNYPNPAVNSTNIKFSLAHNADVSIQMMDMAGRTINTIKETDLAMGEHIIPVNTADLASGDYLYLIRTSGGGGMAGKMSVAHQ